ncbi:MAG: hypothetical protein ACO1RX_03850 [Candidatus Sericytochromatia bacterium]
MKNKACPDLPTLVQALAEGGPTELLEHVQLCPFCCSQPEVQLALATWQALERLPDIAVTGDFEARLSARLARAERQQQKWLLLDRFWAWLHVPALAALVLLLFGLPQPESPLRAQVWQRPPAQAFRPEAFPLGSSQGLSWLSKIYRERHEG